MTFVSILLPLRQVVEPTLLIYVCFQFFITGVLGIFCARRKTSYVVSYASSVYSVCLWMFAKLSIFLLDSHNKPELVVFCHILCGQKTPISESFYSNGQELMQWNPSLPKTQVEKE